MTSEKSKTCPVAAPDRKRTPYTQARHPDTARNMAEKTFPDRHETGLIEYGRHLAAELHDAGRFRTAEAYTSALNSLEKFRHGAEIPLTAVRRHLMTAYESHLKARNLCRNTTSFYMRNLRAIYNRAADEGLIAQCHPFRHVYTGTDKTVKRAVTLPVIRRIKEADLTGRPHLQLARDLFMLSFYTRGTSFIDLCHLRTTNLRNGTLSYRRRKTGQLIRMRWEACMQDIVRTYHQPESNFMLPILGNEQDSYRRYRNAEHTVNHNLRKLGLMLGLPLPLTMYVARHSWASAAQSRKIPVSIISEGMGHESEKTTRIYLASLGMNAVDRANRDILRAL